MVYILKYKTKLSYAKNKKQSVGKKKKKLIFIKIFKRKSSNHKTLMQQVTKIQNGKMGLIVGKSWSVCSSESSIFSTYVIKLTYYATLVDL